jgi:hypothetical protein
MDEDKYKLSPTDANGYDMWQKLVKPSKNIKLVLSGHIGEKGVAFRTDINSNGNKVQQMTFNAQMIGEDNGGDGWLRILEFLPDGKTVKVKTFSPLFAISPTTQKFAYRTGVNDQFDFLLE